MNATATQTRTALVSSDMKCRCANVVTASGETTRCTKFTNRTFAPGHDAKLKSLLGLAQANGESVTVTTPGDADDSPATVTEMSPLEAAGLFGNFGYMVVEIANKLTAKREKSAAHKAKLAANKAKRETDRATKKAKETREPATAKVGRWERTGFLVTQKTGDQVFEFAKKDGEVERVAKFQLI